jgi:hypothetical protein
MKLSVLIVVVLAMLGSFPALAQDQASCKAYFQVLEADKGMPGLRTGMDAAQKKWWDSNGQKKYPGLCLSGAIASGDKPRYLVIWSKSTSIGQTSPAPSEVYGQTATALQATAPTTRIYQPRWDLASVTIVNVLNDGSLLLPPVYFEADDRAIGAFAGAGPINSLHPGSMKVLKAALDYLFQERVFLSNPD